MTFKVDPAERLFGPAAPDAAGPRRRFAVLLAACFLIHAALLAILLHEDGRAPDQATQEQEIPVEVVVLPPEEKPAPLQKKLPIPPLDLVTPPIVKPKPPPEKVDLEDADEAHDAPKAGNAATTTKGTPDTETKAPRAAPPPKLVAPNRAHDKPEQEKAEASAKEPPKPAAPSAAPKPADDNPDAEPLDKAELDQPAKSKDKPKPQDSKKPPTEGKKITVAQQLAALSPAPNFSFGSTAKSAPISGGNEKASYESVLFGLIKRQMRFPSSLSGRHMTGGGMVNLYIDELGHLTHQVVYRTSGVPDLDAAWIAAIRRAAPFPAPPRGLPHAFTLEYSIERE